MATTDLSTVRGVLLQPTGRFSFVDHTNTAAQSRMAALPHPRFVPMDTTEKSK